MSSRLLLFLGLTAAIAGCGVDTPAVTDARVRTDIAVPLGADAGWAVGATPGVGVDTPFRVRFEIESPVAAVGVGIEARRNNGPWSPVLARDLTSPGEPSTPGVRIVEPTAWTAGDATTDLLPASDAAWAGGAGAGLDSIVGPIPIGQSEWEWAVVIDRAATAREGDRFDLRLVDERGRALPGIAPLSFVLRVPSGQRGSGQVETPGA